MNIDDMLFDPGLVVPKKAVDKVLRRIQFRLFGKLFRFDIIKEGFTPPRLFQCDEVLCDTDALMKKILSKELSLEEIKLMYKDKPWLIENNDSNIQTEKS